jgi:hypothetical protein
MRRIAVCLAVHLVFVATSSAALTVGTNAYCNPPVGGNWGIADKIDGTGGGAFGVGSGAPYNLDMSDDALVCVDGHTATLAVNTAAKFINEVANTASHELGHLLGLEHGDGTAASLMNGAYDGLDKGFTAAAEQAVLNHASQSAVQVVWLDFDALQPGLLPVYKPFSQSPVLSIFGIGAGQIAATITSIIAGIQNDYTGPWTGGASYEFYTLEIDALNATSGVGNYSTLSFVATPEPGTALLVAAGFGVLAGLRRSSRAGISAS